MAESLLSTCSSLSIFFLLYNPHRHSPSSPRPVSWFWSPGSGLQFWSLLLLQVLIRIARAEAVASRHSTIMICVLQTEEELGQYDSAISSLQADKESVVTFGPWKGGAGVQDLLDCVQMDIQRQGYSVSIQPHLMEKSFLSRSYDFFYRLVFTWW